MLELAKKDRYTAFLRNGIIIICNPGGWLIGEFSRTGEVAGIWRPQSRREQDTAKALVSIAIEQITKAYLYTDSYAGRREYPVEIVKETPKRYRIKLLGKTPLPGRSRWGDEGDEVMVPKYTVGIKE